MKSYDKNFKTRHFLLSLSCLTETNFIIFLKTEKSFTSNIAFKVKAGPTSLPPVLHIRDVQLVSQGTEGLKGILRPQLVQESRTVLLPRSTKNAEN